MRAILTCAGGFSYRITEAQSVALHSNRTNVQYALYESLGFRRMLPALTEALGKAKSAGQSKKCVRSDRQRTLTRAGSKAQDTLRRSPTLSAKPTPASSRTRSGRTSARSCKTATSSLPRPAPACSASSVRPDTFCRADRADVKFPPNVTFIGQVLYGSIGYVDAAVAELTWPATRAAQSSAPRSLRRRPDDGPSSVRA